MKIDLTAVAYIIFEDKLLYIKHPKLGFWLPPGGHIDPNEAPEDAAVRETKEETNLDIELLLPAKKIESTIIMRDSYLPFYADIHDVGDHWHHGLCYLATVDDVADMKLEEGITEYKWVGLDELEESGVKPEHQEIAKIAFDRYTEEYGKHI